MKQLFHLTLLPLSGALLSCGIAHAEGNQNFTGAFGVNRVVRSDANATTPRLATSGTVALSFVQPVNVAGKFDVEVNPFNNKATAYLGASAADSSSGALQQFDAGLQFETGVFGNNAPGWSAFFSSNNVFRNPVIDQGAKDPIPWTLPSTSPQWTTNKDSYSRYVNATGSIGTDMTFKIIPDGPCSVYIKAIGIGDSTFIYNTAPVGDPLNRSIKTNSHHLIAPWYDPTYAGIKYNNANQNKATLKRVSGMTRSKRKAELDGSQMSAVWSNCTLNGGAWVESKAGGGVISHVDQTVTGYDSPDGMGTTAYDRRIGSGAGKTTAESRTITQFVVTGLTNDQARSSVNGASVPARYAGETVNMNMGTATALEGDQLEWE